MKELKIIENGRLQNVTCLNPNQMQNIKGGICACDARFAMSSGTIQIGVCICDKKYHKREKLVASSNYLY